jgi:hypothetical protein
MRNEVKPRDLEFGLKYDLEIHVKNNGEEAIPPVLYENMEWDGARFKYNKRKIEDGGREYDMWDYYNMNIKNNKNKIYHHDKKDFAGRYTIDQIFEGQSNRQADSNEYKTVAQKALNKATNDNPDLNRLIRGYGRKKSRKKARKKTKKKGSKKKINKKKRKTRKK